MATPPPPRSLRVRSLRDLPDDLIPEILLRLPPHDPRHLFRCSAVCKPWRRLLTDPAFLRRYRAFHGVPPLLGVLLPPLLEPASMRNTSRFVRATSFRPRTIDHADWFVCDARHGRILFTDMTDGYGEIDHDHDLFLWSPVTDEQWGLDLPSPSACQSLTVAVLCAAAAREEGCDCDHLDCHGGPFLVVYMGIEDGGMMHARVYSSETGAWSDATCAQHPSNLVNIDIKETDPSALVGNRIYFYLSEANSKTIVEFDLGRRKLAFLDEPSAAHDRDGILMPAMGGGLGFASVRESCLYLWSRETSSDTTAAAWTQSRVLELNKLPDRETLHFIERTVVGFAEGLGIIFVKTTAGVFAVNLESGEFKKITNRGSFFVLPYMSFYTPDHAVRRPPVP